MKLTLIYFIHKDRLNIFRSGYCEGTTSSEGCQI